ncbi:MAG: N-acetyl-gamma-glutamyl-phosphate reductase [Proteobacteria bacterium]|nr:N-acetyl-gamma-glutamyl-phosphate reductase [Pseudomonadota bacterium]
MIKTAVVGATGYSGLELIRILLTHPQVKLTVITSRSQPGIAISEIFPALKNRTNLITESLIPAAIAEKADIVFTALPHGASMDVVNSLVEQNMKVIDLSADFRFRDQKVYTEWYGEHKAPLLLDKAVYGLPELNRAEIKSATLVGNPGCYPTSAILPLLPLLKEKVIDDKTVVINSASGVTGAGRSASTGNIFCEVNESFKPYKVGEHRHTPEIEEALKSSSGSEIKVTFTPHLAPMNRGILSTVTANLKEGMSTSKILNILKGFYEHEPFVRICPEGVYPDTSDVRGSNYCDIGVKVDERTGRVVIMSALDNLVKGAAGQAVQNMNLMSGLGEDAGLRHIPISI